jgi:hypothetical protein
MRDFVAAVMAGAPRAPEGAPPALIDKNHLAPLAFKMGMAGFRDVYAASAVMAARRAALLAEIVPALRAHQIRVALIKGIAYAGTLYPDPAERPMHDIDLLIPRLQTPEAVRAVFTMDLWRIGRHRRRSPYYHAIEIRRGDLIVELHRGIMQHHRTDIRMGDVWRRARPDPAAGGAERLDPVDETLLCILHIARHELAVPALNYVDVARLWQRLDDTGRALVRARAAEYSVARPVAAVLSLVELMAAGAPGRPAIAGGRFLPSTDEILSGEGPARLRQIGQKLLLTDGVRDALGIGLHYGTTLVDGWRRGRPP